MKKQKIKASSKRAKIPNAGKTKSALFNDRLDIIQKTIDLSVNELWKNQRELFSGLVSAEINFRAHVAILNDIISSLLQEGHVLKSVKIAGMEGKEQKLSWGVYYDEAEKSAKAEREFKNRSLNKNWEERISNDIPTKLKKINVMTGGNNKEAIEELDKFMAFTKEVYDELGKLSRGEPYDKEVLLEAEKLIDQALEKDSVGELFVGGEKNDSPTEMCEKIIEASPYPEGAAIFGG